MTVAITDYASLTTAIGDFSTRTYTAGETDRIIGLAEAEFRLELGPSFAKEANASLSVTAGTANLPTGFIRPLSAVHATYGAMTQQSLASVRARRVWDTGGIPDIYAVTGSTIEFAPSFTGTISFDYEGTLTGLSSGNPTNWLITNAPQAYLSMCLSMEKVYNEDWQSAATLRSAAMQTLYDLGIQSMVAQLGRGGVTLPGSTP